MELPLEVNQARFTEALNSKKASASCISCGSNNWALMPQAAILSQWVNVMPAPGIPVCAAICNNCGFLRLHALGVLGLLPQEATSSEKDNGQT